MKIAKYECWIKSTQAKICKEMFNFNQNDILRSKALSDLILLYGFYEKNKT